MKLRLYISALAVLLLAGCGDNSSKPAQGAGGNLPDSSADYGGALANGQNKALKTVDTASLNQAVQMFNANEGRFPKDLNELVTDKLIAKVPTPPRGMKIVYDPPTGSVSVVPE